MSNTIDTEHRDLPICPHCGHEHKEAWDWGFPGAEGCIETWCESCGKEMIVSKSVTITYTTTKPKEPK
jgi:hypothetical protein